jgi:hypothetical protein
MKEEPNAFLQVERGQVEDHEESEWIPLRTDTIIIGRPPAGSGPDVEPPDVKITDDYVSQNHAKIYYSLDQRCFVVEESADGTPNGTFVNDHKVQPGRPCPLRDGDVLSLAKVGDGYRVVLRFWESDVKPPAISEEKRPAKGLSMDLEARRVWVDGKEIGLRRKEFDLLAFLYRNRGKACSKDEIASNVWAEDNGVVVEEVIDLTVHRVRNKIEADTKNPRYIKAVHVGLRLDT